MLTCHLLNEGSDRLVNEVAFEFIPTANQATGTLLLQLEEGAQGAEDVIADGPLPAHEELLRMADLLEGPMVAFNGPVLSVDMHGVTIGDFHPLFFRGRIVRSVSRRCSYRPFETHSQSRTHADEGPCRLRATPASQPAHTHAGVR